MQCPKCRKVELLEGSLDNKFGVQYCSECKGTWIPAREYEAWQSRQSDNQLPPPTAPESLNVNFVKSPYDDKAALCPECRRYLSRAKVNLNTAFYVERCPNCRGIWCDKGEWNILEQLGLHTTIEQLFTNEWQSKVREKQTWEKERQATADKIGPELAEQVFQLGELLAKHPNGDFGVAYLMRRVAVNIQPQDFTRDK